MCRIRCLPAGVRCVETLRVSEFLLCLIFLVFSCARRCCRTWHISSVLTWIQCYPGYIPHPSFESGNRRNVFILVRVHRAHTNGGTGVWVWGFEWLWLHFGMWRCVLWVVGTSLLPTLSGCTLFLALQFIGFIVSASFYPRRRSNVLIYQGSDNSFRRRSACFAAVFTPGIKKHGVG